MISYLTTMALTFGALTILFGFYVVSGDGGLLPLWYWGSAVLTGVLGAVGGWLMRKTGWLEQQVAPRALWLALGFSLPLGSLMLSRDLLWELPVTPDSLATTGLVATLWGVGAAFRPKQPSSPE